LEEYVQRVVEDQAVVERRQQASVEEMEAALDQLAEMGRGLPHLSDYALTRESIYEGRD
jgi:hypothetical protein